MRQEPLSMKPFDAAGPETSLLGRWCLPRRQPSNFRSSWAMICCASIPSPWMGGEEEESCLPNSPAGAIDGVEPAGSSGRPVRRIARTATTA
eukprot:Skav211031  [mRNA]  locus=scaffold4832:31921:40770:- [translate_table: standard]